MKDTQDNKTVKSWLVIVSGGGVVGGTLCHLLIQTLPSKFVDYIFYIFALQGMAVVFLFDDESISYLIFSIIHFSFLCWIVLWLRSKHFSFKQWLLIIAGFVAVNVALFLATAYIFFNCVMKIEAS